MVYLGFRYFRPDDCGPLQLFIGALLAYLAGAAAITALQTKSCESSATVLISFSGETALAQVYQGTQAAQERLSSYAAIAGGHAVAERAVAQFHLPVNPDALVSQTHVEFTPKSTLFTVTVTDTDPKRAAALAKAMADSFATMVGTLGASPKVPAAPVTAAPSRAPVPLQDGDGQPTAHPLASETTMAPDLRAVPAPTVPQATSVVLPVARATMVEQPAPSAIGPIDDRPLPRSGADTVARLPPADRRPIAPINANHTYLVNDSHGRTGFKYVVGWIPIHSVYRRRSTID
jgi:hypothetical protein